MEYILLTLSIVFSEKMSKFGYIGIVLIVIGTVMINLLGESH